MQIRRYAKRLRPEPDFSYNNILGNWWMRRAADNAHQRAYRNIARFIQDACPRPPRLILDYACGAGNLLSLLSKRLPYSRLVGLDGSSFLLDQAEKRLSRLPDRCKRRMTLIETALPGQSILPEKADLILYCFPNMIPSCLQDKGSMSEFNRSISRNLRQMVVRDGICVRAEYASTRRHEWPPAELMRVSFEEGSLDTAADGAKLKPWFRVLASAYFRSNTMEDVYQQTGDVRDKKGGYLITVLRAL